jgi:putative membrane protein
MVAPPAGFGAVSTVPAGGTAPRFEVRVTADSHFAWLRTRLAVERTMMAYMRTSTSLIAFGFTIFQFIDRLHSAREQVRYPEAPWYLGLALIFCGIAAAGAALWEYHKLIEYMWSNGYGKLAGMHGERHVSSLYAITVVLILIGLFAFVAVLLSGRP